MNDSGLKELPEEEQGQCICPICKKVYTGNPKSDQICFECWIVENWENIPKEEELSLSGAGGWSYYQIPNTVKLMSDTDWDDYIKNCPKNAFFNSIYRTVLHNSATPPLNGIQVIIGIQRYHIIHNGWADAGYHGAITPDGLAYLMRNWTYKGAHAHAVGNAGSLGWCMIGNFSGSGFPTQQQINTYGRMSSITSRYINIRDSSGHRWVDNHPTSCPGVNVSLGQIREWAKVSPPPPPPPIKWEDMMSVVEFRQTRTETVEGTKWYIFEAAEGFVEVEG